MRIAFAKRVYLSFLPFPLTTYLDDVAVGIKVFDPKLRDPAYPKAA